MIPTFLTERLILKAPVLEDAAAYQKNFNDYEVMKYLTAAIPHPYPDDGAYSFLKNVILPRQGQGFWNWGIFLKDNETELIGSIEITKKAQPTNRGFWLAKEHWGKGLMSEAIVPPTSFAFRELGFTKMIFGNAIANQRSSKIKLKTGCKMVDIIKTEFVSGTKDEEIWEITKDDWFKHNQG